MSAGAEPGAVRLYVKPIDGDPDLPVGGIMTLERADGRSVWRQRLMVVLKAGNDYVLEPCE